MTDFAAAVRNDLRRLVKGEVHFDDRARAMYSTAACAFEMEPLGVVAPKHARDVVRVVQYCRRHFIAITGRGAGSSVAGQAIGPGIILDFTRHMNRVTAVDRRARTARVQPGVVLGRLNRRLAREGLMFGPDPSSGAFCTLGGMVNTNAGGAHSLKFGTTRDCVTRLKVVLDDGEDAVLERAGPPKRGTRLGEILAGTLGLLRGFSAAISEAAPDAPKNSSGYHLFDVLHGRQADLHRLYCGSEGTLALLTEATLSLAPTPKRRTLAVLGYETGEAACDSVQSILRLGPSALEFVDDSTARLLLSYAPEAARWLGPPGAFLLVEFDDAPPRRLADLKRAAHPRSFLTPSPKEAAEVWRIRKAVSPALERRPGRGRSTRVNEDVCVHPSRVGEYVALVKRLQKKYGYEAAIFGHAGSGNIHVNLFVDTRDVNELERSQVLALEVYRSVKEMRGTMSGEHGDGMLRAPYMREFWGDLYGIFDALKSVFDPAGIFNPGKKLAPKGYRYSQDMRIGLRPAFTDSHVAKLIPIEQHLHRCNGCAKCHTYCPLYLEEPEEFSSPRAKVNLLMAAAQNRIELEELTGDRRFRKHLQACIRCRKCLTECPAGTDLPSIAEGFRSL